MNTYVHVMFLFFKFINGSRISSKLCSRCHYELLCAEFCVENLTFMTKFETSGCCEYFLNALAVT